MAYATSIRLYVNAAPADLMADLIRRTLMPVTEKSLCVREAAPRVLHTHSSRLGLYCAAVPLSPSLSLSV